MLGRTDGFETTKKKRLYVASFSRKKPLATIVSLGAGNRFNAG
jgi:hypothetical protein